MTSHDASAREYLPALQGLRWYSALAVLGTHTAFLTGVGQGQWYQHVVSRLDLAVAVFFALSGFLLWQPYAQHARGRKKFPRALRYYRARAVRILPAYWVVICVVLTAVGADSRMWLTNLTVTQSYFPFSLATGLTQMWSLSVEVSFYLVLPLGATIIFRLTRYKPHWRIPLLFAVSVVTIGWVFIPWPHDEPLNPQLWFPGFLPWFIAGMIIAELKVEGITLSSTARRVWYLCAFITFGAACTDLGGPPDLQEVQSWQFATKVVLGALLAAAIVGPAALSPQGHPHRILDRPIIQTWGRWSYSFFLWHLAVLTVLLPILQGHRTWLHAFMVWGVTAVFSLGVSALSYSWIEQPVARWVASLEERLQSTEHVSVARAKKAQN